jgi:hypothetical protein
MNHTDKFSLVTKRLVTAVSDERLSREILKTVAVGLKKRTNASVV